MAQSSSVAGTSGAELNDDTFEEVIRLATDRQTDQAIMAVANGQATKEQQDIAQRAAQQAGSRGNRAREAFKGK